MSAIPPLKTRIRYAQDSLRRNAPDIGTPAALICSGYLLTNNAWKDMYPWEPAREALESGDIKKAIHLADELLAQVEKRRDAGSIIHAANQVLGRAALREGRTADALAYLHAAAETPGSPVLDSFGPRMTLAQELLAQGERDAVIAYLDRVALFWATFSEERAAAFATHNPKGAETMRRVVERNRQRIEFWKTEIRAGKEPRLNRVDWPGED